MGKKRQLGVALDDELRQQLEALANKAGRSIADEIRQRIERTLVQDADPETSKLMAAIARFATLVRLQTNHTWHSHPAAQWVMRTMITGRLQRLRPSGERVFAPDELPAARLVASDDPEAMGLGLEAIDFHTPSADELQRKSKESKS